jgi:beta-catenin-like protein 1
MNGNEKRSNGKSTSTTTMEDALDRMVSVSVATAAIGDQPAFIPASTWQGSKDGYYFGTSERGTGYHIDNQQHDSTLTNQRQNRSGKRPRLTLTAQDLLQEAERAVDPEQKVLDLTPKAVKGACISLKKICDKNQLQRAKYVDTPEHFMESELALFQQISAFSAFAADPSLYEILLQEGVLDHFVPLLSHDNSDVALTVIHVLVEWIDPEAPVMVERIVRDEALKWSIANLGRLNPEVEEDAVGIEDLLTLVENTIELDPNASLAIAEQTSLIPWLFQQIETRQSGRAAEVLSLVLQDSQVYSTFSDLSQVPPYSSPLLDEPPSEPMDGMEILLQALAIYRKTQPPGQVECDFLENVCLALGAALTYSSVNVDKFLEAQGIELVLRCLKEKVHAGGVALKLLDLQSTRACEQIVKAGGLKYIFPLFVGRAIPKPIYTSKKARKEWLHMLEENTISILYTLTRYLTPQSPDDAMERLVVKFSEDDNKCNRLVELLLKYDTKARMAEYKFYRSNDEEDELAALAFKLKGGGDLFHRLGAICAFCCVGSKKCHALIRDQLILQKSGIGGT